MENLNHSVCVIGAGAWGSNHIKTLTDLKSLGGIAETNQTILNTLSKKYSNTSVKIFSDISSAIDSKLFDGFIIATPAETHYSIAKKIIQKKYMS